jgi:hypothetical protein
MVCETLFVQHENRKYITLPQEGNRTDTLKKYTILTSHTSQLFAAVPNKV